MRQRWASSRRRAQDTANTFPDRELVVGTVEMLEAVFDPQGYGMAMPVDSPYRKAIDVTILEAIRDERRKQVFFKYLGEKR